MKRLIVVLLVSCVLAVGATTPAVAHNVPRRCGFREETGAGWWKLRAHGGVRCPAARRVAEKWHDRVMSGRDPDRFKINGRSWRCGSRDAGYESVKVRCRSGETKLVHFYWGS